MRANLKSTFLAVLGIASLAVAVPMSIANAQDTPQDPGQRGGIAQRAGGADNPFQRGGQAPQGMQGMMQRMGGGGGGTAMTQDNNFLYIVQGSQVFKLNKRDLSVVAVGRLPGGGPGGPGGGQGGPGAADRAGGRRGGGGAGGGGLPGDPFPPID